MKRLRTKEIVIFLTVVFLLVKGLSTFSRQTTQLSQSVTSGEVVEQPHNLHNNRTETSEDHIIKADDGIQFVWKDPQTYHVLIDGRKRTSVFVKKAYSVKTPEQIQNAIDWRYSVEPKPIHLDRIYFINLDRNVIRREIMEHQLSMVAYDYGRNHHYDIEYHRVAALKGQNDTCISRINGKRCIGVSGLIMSNLYIMDHLNITGTTLVLEDDFVIDDLEKLLKTVYLVPQDWDILRWDCKAGPLPEFQQYTYAFKTSQNASDIAECKQSGRKKCYHCGGTHAIMYRSGASVEKLRVLWSRQPYEDIDCALTSRSSEVGLNSYCIQTGVGSFHYPSSEYSDIPKHDQEHQQWNQANQIKQAMKKGGTIWIKN